MAKPTSKKGENPFRYLIAANDTVGLSAVTKLVLIMIVKHRNGKTGLCCPSLKTLMDLTGESESTVKRATAELKKRGILTWKRGWSNKFAKGIPNRYTLNLDAMKALSLRRDAQVTDDTCYPRDAQVISDDAQVKFDPKQPMHRSNSTDAQVTHDLITVINCGDKPNCGDGELLPPPICFDSVVLGSDSQPTTKDDTPSTRTEKSTLIPDIKNSSRLVKASAVKIIIPATEPLQDPLAGTSRGALVRAAREADHIVYGEGVVCAGCRIRIAVPDRPFCPICDEEDPAGHLAYQDTLIKLHQEGGDWRNSIITAFTPFNEKRLVEIAGRVIARAILKLLRIPSAANLDRVLQLLKHRIESVSKLKPTAGVIAALEDLHTTILWVHAFAKGQGVAV